MIYPRRYLSEPRKRRAYEVACDLIYIYGGRRSDFRCGGITKSESREIFNTALTDLRGRSRVDFVYGR